MVASSRSFCAGLLVLATSCAAPADGLADERALHELWRRFERAFNAGDAKAAASLYAVDADRINSRGERVTGRAAIEKGYAALLARRQADPTSKPFHATMRVRLLSDGVGVLDGEWQGTRDGKLVRGQFTLMATRQAGTWLLAAGRDRGVIEPR